MYGYYSRAVSNQEWVIVERVQYLENNLPIGLQTLVEYNGEKTEVAEELSLTGL
jgi:hypothetical protein